MRAPNTHDRPGLLATATDNLFEDMKTTCHLLVLPVRWPAIYPTTSRHSQLDHATSSSRLIVWRAGVEADRWNLPYVVPCHLAQRHAMSDVSLSAFAL